MPTSLVNPVIKANFNNVFFKGRGWISPPPPSYDPGGCGFKRMRENGRQAELLQEATGCGGRGRKVTADLKEGRRSWISNARASPDLGLKGENYYLVGIDH